MDTFICPHVILKCGKKSHTVCFCFMLQTVTAALFVAFHRDVSLFTFSPCGAWVSSVISICLNSLYISTYIINFVFSQQKPLLLWLSLNCPNNLNVRTCFKTTSPLKFPNSCSHPKSWNQAKLPFSAHLLKQLPYEFLDFRNVINLKLSKMESP